MGSSKKEPKPALLVTPKIEGDGSHFDPPKSSSNPSSMSKDEWLATYGTILQSERRALASDPEWATNP